MKAKEEKTISGQNIVSLFTINSMYADGQIGAVLDDDTIVRIPLTTFVTILNDYDFKAVKKTKFWHLVEMNPISP